jgi:hypothetical protein
MDGGHGALHRGPVLLQQSLSFLRVLRLADLVHLRLHRHALSRVCVKITPVMGRRSTLLLTSSSATFAVSVEVNGSIRIQPVFPRMKENSA